MIKEEEYNLHDGLAVQLHEYALKKLNLDWNTMDTDDSNNILEICEDVINQMHDELNSRLEELKKSLNSQTEQNSDEGGRSNNHSKSDGSPKVELYCKNPKCFMTYIAKHKIKEKSLGANNEISSCEL